MTSIHRIGWLRIAGGLAAFALVAALAGRGVAADDPSASSASKTLEGIWVTSDSSELDATWTIKGDTLKATVNGMEYGGKMKVDEAAKPHATIDVELSEGPEDEKGKVAKGIYKLDGEKLVVTIARPGLDRPKEFEPVPDEAFVFEMKKEKTEKK